jgi:hypothetical protein
VKKEYEPIVLCPTCGKKHFVSPHTIQWINTEPTHTKCPFCGKINEVEKKKSKPMRRPQEPTIYYLVTYSHFVNGDSLGHASWCTRDDAFGGLVWKNFVGGMCPCSDDDRVHEVTMANDIMELDWTKTYMVQGLEEDFYSGWLSPNGEFVQSTRHMYENTAQFIIGKDLEELKRAGWLKLERYENTPYFTPRKLVTKQQYEWLKDKGYQGINMEELK